MKTKREIIAKANNVSANNVNCKNCTKYEREFGGFCALFNVPTDSREFCKFFCPLGEDGDAT